MTGRERQLSIRLMEKLRRDDEYRKRLEIEVGTRTAPCGEDRSRPSE